MDAGSSAREKHARANCHRDDRRTRFKTLTKSRLVTAAKSRDPFPAVSYSARETSFRAALREFLSSPCSSLSLFAGFVGAPSDTSKMNFYDHERTHTATVCLFPPCPPLPEMSRMPPTTALFPRRRTCSCPRGTHHSSSHDRSHVAPIDDDYNQDI